MKSVTEFLKTEEAKAAANLTGNSTIADFRPDSDGRVGLHFNGHYTVDEVQALLLDLKAVQAAYEHWAPVTILPVLPMAAIRAFNRINERDAELREFAYAADHAICPDGYGTASLEEAFDKQDLERACLVGHYFGITGEELLEQVTIADHYENFCFINHQRKNLAALLHSYGVL